jgi:hypothetical protein
VRVASERHMTLLEGCVDAQVLLPGLAMLPGTSVHVTALLEWP